MSNKRYSKEANVIAIPKNQSERCVNTTTIFEQLKQTLTSRQVTERYGLTVNHHGMARCPFHDDHNPSMKIDERFHCFACGADGDVIDYTGKLFGLRPIDAARKLASDFGLSTELQPITPIKHAEPPITERFCICVLWRYLRLLRIWQVRYEPKLGEPMDDRFVESLLRTATVRDFLDDLCHRTPADARQAMSILTEGGLIMRLNDYVERKEIENGIVPCLRPSG